MMNPLAVMMSENSLADQINFLTEHYHYITSVIPSDAHTDMRADYLENVDAVARGYDGKNYNVQFKIREKGNNDFILIAKKLTGKSVRNNSIGFTWHNVKYTFNLKSADIYVETLGNGETYILTREEINSLERCPKLGLAGAITGIQPKIVYADDGSEILTGDYYVFINAAKIKALKTAILEASFC